MEFIKPALHGNTNRIQHVVCKKILPCIIRYVVAYFVHHVSDNYVDSSDLYVVLSDLYVDLSDLHVVSSDVRSLIC